MRAIRWVVVIAVAFVLGGTATALFLRRTPAAGIAGRGDQQILYWYDPMAPQQHFDAPGKSPYMDMPLVPKYADAAATDPGTVRIEPRQVQNLGVRTGSVERGLVTRTVRATGTLAYDERAVTVVQSRVAGIVDRLYVRAPLAQVKRGDPLLTLLAPDWTAAQEEYLALRRAQAPGLEEARAAARQRLLLTGMDEAQIGALEHGGRAAARITIAAPRDGVVTELAVREGATVMAGTPLMRLNGVHNVWLMAALAESDGARIAPGAAANASLAAFPGEAFAGSVEALLPEIDAATRTQTARIVLPNPDHRLAPGMFASVEISPGPVEAAQLLVPSEAVIATGTRNVVIVDAGSGRYRAQEVRIGVEGGGRSAVIGGLREGDRVVLSGQFLIDSEASLSGTLARLGGDAGVAKAPAAALPAPDDRRSGPGTQVASGTLERVDGDQWTIATDPMPSLGMAAMTMSFVAPRTLDMQGIRAGDRVTFRFRRNDAGRDEIVRIAPADGGAGAGPRP